jgi:RNA polymerase sigma factor (sigma-70 family)
MSRPGPPARYEPFPPTMLSAVISAGSAEAEPRRRAWDRLVRAYRPAVLSYVAARFGRSKSDAEDAVDSFFARCIAQSTFESFDPEKARFRTFLRVCLDRFVTDELRAERAIKRGGGNLAAHVDLDDLKHEPAADLPSAEAAFDAEWVRRVVTLAVEQMRDELTASGKTEHFRVFELYHLQSEDAPPYATLAKELGISVFDLTNRLSFARRKFKAAVLEVLRDLTANEAEWREEARAVLGVEV